MLLGVWKFWGVHREVLRQRREAIKKAQGPVLCSQLDSCNELVSFDV